MRFKTKIILVIGILFLGVSGAVNAQEQKKRILPLEEFVELAVKNDTRFEQIIIDELPLKYQKTIDIPAKDIILSVKRQYSFILDPSEDEEAENTFSLEKLFPYTGTSLTADYTSDFARNSGDVSSELTVLISQPIAENAFGRATRLQDKISGISIDLAKHQIVEAYEDYLASLIQRYYDWYSLHESLNTARVSYDENLKLLENIQERLKSKIALPIDVNKIKVQVLAKKENLVLLQDSYDNYLNLIKEAIHYAGSEDLQPAMPSVYVNSTIDFKNDYAAFKTDSRTMQMLDLLKNKASVETSKAADELLPSIDLFVGYSLEGTDYGMADSEGTVYGGLSVDWPFTGSKEKARYEVSKINRDKTKLSSDNTAIRLETNLKNLYQQIQSERELIDLAEEKIKLSQAIVEDESRNYSLGQVTLKDLIDEVNELEDNKFNLINHSVKLRKLIIEWLRLTDNLVQKDQVIPD